MKWVSMVSDQPHTSPTGGVKLATIGLWSSGNAFSGVMNHTSPSGSPTKKNDLGLFFMVGARPLSSSGGKS
jgi:hypothetical protein